MRSTVDISIQEPQSPQITTGVTRPGNLAKILNICRPVAGAAGVAAILAACGGVEVPPSGQGGADTVSTTTTTGSGGAEPACHYAMFTNAGAPAPLNEQGIYSSCATKPGTELTGCLNAQLDGNTLSLAVCAQAGQTLGPNTVTFVVADQSLDPGQQTFIQSGYGGMQCNPQQEIFLPPCEQGAQYYVSATMETACPAPNNDKNCQIPAGDILNIQNTQQ